MYDPISDQRKRSACTEKCQHVAIYLYELKKEKRYQTADKCVLCNLRCLGLVGLAINGKGTVNLYSRLCALLHFMSTPWVNLVVFMDSSHPRVGNNNIVARIT